jgi:predicted dinucleotide-binding enzyme
VRDPGSRKTLAAREAALCARATGPAAAIEGADVAAFAPRWDAVPATVATLPPLAGRIVIDALNRLHDDPARSATHDLSDLLRGAKIAKAFDTIGFENLATARSRREPAAVFVASDDPDAKRVAMNLVAQLGFVPDDADGLANARALEHMVRVWPALAQAHGRGVAFAISRG